MEPVGARRYTALAYAFADLSGPHFNPAISLSLGCTGNMGVGMACGYIVAQTVGAVMGGAILVLSTGGCARSRLARSMPCHTRPLLHKHRGVRTHARACVYERVCVCEV